MKNSYPWFKFDVNEWLLGSILYKSFAAQGLFINICAMYWRASGNLTVSEINKRFNNPVEMKDLTGTLIHSKDDGTISIKFLDELLLEKDAESKVKAYAGSMGGKARAAKQHEEDSNESNEEPTTDESFEQFWNAYDYKTGSKTKIQKKWLKMKKSDRELIMAYIPKYVLSTPDKKFRKHPETFLNNEGWLDEIIGSKQPATNGVKPPAEQAKVPEFDGTPLTREKFRPQRRDESYQLWLEKNNQFFEAQDRYNETLKKGN